MADAPVLVFAPGESQPEFKTSTDRRGVVCFAPDRPGLWVLQVRAEGGHGMRINLQVDESMLASSAGGREGRFSAWQKLVMAASVVWGFLGTALFFRRRGKER
jgi:nickel transport protein